MKKMIIFGALILSGFMAQGADKNQVVHLQVTKDGFDPKTVNVTPGTPVTLEITRKSDDTCATSIVIPSKKIKKDLPLNKSVSIDIGRLEKGEIRFGCQMELMEGGTIIVK